MHDVTRESVVAVTEHFADAFVRENVARVYVTLLRRNDVQKLDADAILFGEIKCKKRDIKCLRDFSAWFMLKSDNICKNNDHACMFGSLAESLGRCLNTQPVGHVFKQLPQDPANVNA